MPTTTTPLTRMPGFTTAIDGSLPNASSTRQGSVTARWPTTLSSPRRATVTLDARSVPSGTTSTASAAGIAIYDKQLLWKQHGQKKVEHMTLELLGEEDLACTFAPKINRSSSQQRKLPASGGEAVAMVSSGRALAVSSPRELVSDGDRSDCSSSQYSASSPRTVRSIDSTDLRGAHEALHRGGAYDEECDDPELAMPVQTVHPTESQENSIVLHLVRQERAREEAQRAQHKLASTQPRKDFTKVTTARPFELSVTNRKPRRSTSASPTQRAARTRHRTGSTNASGSSLPISTSGDTNSGGASNGAGPQALVKRRSQGSQDDGAGGAGGSASAANPDEESNQTLSSYMEAQAIQWQQERATLMSIIDTQKRELERRERAQDDATRLAETFASAVQAFEQRLEMVERTTASELSEMKQLLAKQTSATDLLLHALGLSNTPSRSSVTSSPSSPVATPSSPALSTSTATSRRETK